MRTGRLRVLINKLTKCCQNSKVGRIITKFTELKKKDYGTKKIIIEFPRKHWLTASMHQLELTGSAGVMTFNHLK